MKKLLAIVDNWEKLDLYEVGLSPHFMVECAGFGDYGIELALRSKPDVILINLAFENMTLTEIVGLIRAHQSLQDVPLLLIDELREEFTLPLTPKERLLVRSAALPVSSSFFVSHSKALSPSIDEILEALRLLISQKGSA